MPNNAIVVAGLGVTPAAADIYSGGAIPATTQIVYSNGTTLTGASTLTYVAGTGITSDGLISSRVTDGTSGTLGAINTLGGIGITKAAWVGTNVTLANGLYAQTVTDAATATTTNLLTLNHASSGTVAAGFGIRLLQNLSDDGGTNRNATGIVSSWSAATSGSQTSQIIFQTVNAGAGLATALTIAPGGVTIPSTGALVVSSNTASTTAGTGCVILSGGIGVAGAMTITGAVTSAGNVQGSRVQSAASVTTAMATGIVGFWRSGGTIGVAGDAVFQSDLAVDSNFVFRAGITTPATICTLSPGFPAGTTPGLAQVGTSTITGGVTDGYTASHRLSPVYNGAFTVTRHNYFDVNQITGTSTITDAAVMRFDAAIGTHKAVKTGTTKTTPGAVTAWIAININGTLHYMPAYASQTT